MSKSKISYAEKEKICIYINKLDLKHISEKDITDAADKFGIAKEQYPVVFRALTNFLQTGGKTVDRRLKYKGNGKKFTCKSTVKGCWVYNDNITVDDAKKIILEYMTTKITSRALSEKYNISVNQYYDWVRELEVTGTLLGVLILNYKKYAKVDINDAIWLYKHPNTKRKSISALTVGEKTSLERVGNVLSKYLA